MEEETENKAGKMKNQKDPTLRMELSYLRIQSQSIK